MSVVPSAPAGNTGSFFSSISSALSGAASSVTGAASSVKNAVVGKPSTGYNAKANLNAQEGMSMPPSMKGGRRNRKTSNTRKARKGSKTRKVRKVHKSRK